MTWQGSGGGPGGPEDDATRTDLQLPVPPAGAPLPPPAGPPVAPPGVPPATVPPVNSWTVDPAAGGGADGGWGLAPAGMDPLAVPGAPGLVYAGAIPRAIAFVVDYILILVVATIASLPFAEPVTPVVTEGGGYDFGAGFASSGISAVIIVLIEAAYFILLWASAGRATLGMRLLKLQVGTAADGNRIPVATAARRWIAFGSWVSILGFIPGVRPLTSLVVFVWQVILLVTTATHPQKRGLHDRFAGTAMVRPANAGSAGVVVGCLLIGVLIVLGSLVALIFLGGQVSAILSAVGDSV